MSVAKEAFNFPPLLCEVKRKSGNKQVVVVVVVMVVVVVVVCVCVGGVLSKRGQFLKEPTQDRTSQSLKAVWKSRWTSWASNKPTVSVVWT